MTLRCEDLGNAPADQVADHLDRCEACDRELRRRTAEVLGGLPVGGAPSMDDVRRRIRSERQFFLRFAAAAAAALIVTATGWAVLRSALPTPTPAPAPAVEVIPDPPKLAELPELDRQFVQCDGAVSLYLQFCLSCLNTPTEEDKREFLIRALLVLREVRVSMKPRLEKAGATVESVTRDALVEALQTMRASPLESVKLLPSKFNGFKLEGADKLRFDHLLGKTPYRLTIHSQPLYLNFAYLKIALNADAALMAKIEDALWFDLYVNLPKRIEDRDPKIAPKALETVIPLLSPKQQKLYRKIVE